MNVEIFIFTCFWFRRLCHNSLLLVITVFSNLSNVVNNYFDGTMPMLEVRDTTF